MNQMVATAPSQTLFQKYGGFAAVRGLIMDFYDRVLDSDIVAHHFERVDMNQLIDHQTRFIAGIMGGPANMDTGRLARAHRHLSITHEEFDEISMLLGKTCSEGGVADTDTRWLLEKIESHRHDIVGAGVEA